jgi:hypothetical protein
LSDTFIDTLRYNSNNSNISDVIASSNETDISDSSPGDGGDCGGAGTSSSSENLSDRSSSASSSGYLAQNENDAYDPLLTIDSTHTHQVDSLIMGRIDEKDSKNLIYNKYTPDEQKYFKEKERDKEFRGGKKPSGKMKSRANAKHKYKNSEFGMNRELIIRKSNNEKHMNFDINKSNQLLVNKSANATVAPILATSSGSAFNFKVCFAESGKKMINTKTNLNQEYNQEYLNNNSEDEYDNRPISCENSNLKANNQFMQQQQHQHSSQSQMLTHGTKSSTKNSINNNNNSNKNNNLLLNCQTIEEVQSYFFF